MHYFQFNIGDYKSHTSHLTIIEDIAYRRLLDMYYLHEKPLESSIPAISRLIGMREYEKEVEMVLREFFVLLEDQGWINSRADKEIMAYKSKIEQASRAGKASAEARLNGRSTDVQLNIKQEPLTNNQINPILSSQEEKPPVNDRIPYEDIKNLYHQILPMCPKILDLTAKRKSQIAARWKSGSLPDLETWERYFNFISKSDWLTGRCDPAPGRKRFVANLEWITTETNYTNIVEKKYHGR